MKKTIILSLISVFILLGASGTQAEGGKESNKSVKSTATIKGKIIDASTSEELVCAKVYLEGTGISTCTDVNGEYEFNNLAPGNYDIKVEYISYKIKSLTNVKIKSGNGEALNIELESL